MHSASNGLKTTVVIKVIGGNRPSIFGRDLMAELGLQLVQKAPGERVWNFMESMPREKAPRKTTNWTNGRTILESRFLSFSHGLVKPAIIRCRQNFLNPSYLSNKRAGEHREKVDDSDQYFVSPKKIR